jgi:hypothetical protein
VAFAGIALNFVVWGFQIAIPHLDISCIFKTFLGHLGDMAFQLPLELTTIVLDYIIGKENANLAPYATVNRDWQAIVERRSFSNIKINSAKRLAEFNQFPWDQLPWRQRRYHVRKIDLTVELESYDGEARTRYENEEEMQRNNDIFTISIQSLFNTLSEWPDNEVGGIRLSIMARSPGDISAQGPEIRKQRGWEPRILADDIWDMRHDRSYLQFNEEAVGAQCRAVPIITYLDIMGAMGHRKLEPASTSFIASKLPRLHDLELYLDDNCKWNPQIRKRRRNGMYTNPGRSGYTNDKYRLCGLYSVLAS